MSADDPNRLELERIPEEPPAGLQAGAAWVVGPPRYRCPVHGEVATMRFAAGTDAVVCCARCLLDLIRRNVPCLPEG